MQFGIIDIDNNSDYPKFGLNTGARVVSFENVESDSYVELVVEVAGREFRARQWYDGFKLFRNGKEISKGDNNYEMLLKREYTKRLGYIQHVASALGVTNSMLSKIFQKPAKSAREWVRRVFSVIPIDYTEKEYDVFLEYSPTIPDGYDTNFLRLPRDIFYGDFIVQSVPVKGEWIEKRGNILYYEDSDDSSNVHPLKRGKRFLQGNRAKKITREPLDSEISDSFTDEEKFPWEE